MYIAPPVYRLICRLFCLLIKQHGEQDEDGLRGRAETAVI